MLIYDSTNPYDIPTTAVAVAGYVDGAYAWDINGWARFPTAAKIGISVNPFNQIGDALDVETGDATPAQAPAWVKARLSQGTKQPWVYVNRANQRAVEDAMWAAGISVTQAAMWVATLDGTQSVSQYRYPIAAVQYANSTLAGGHYDLSVLTVYGAAAGSLESSMDQATFNTLVAGSPLANLLGSITSTYQAVLASQKAILAAVQGIPGAGSLSAAQAQELQEAHDAAQQSLADLHAIFKGAA